MQILPYKGEVGPIPFPNNHAKLNASRLATTYPAAMSDSNIIPSSSPQDTLGPSRLLHDAYVTKENWRDLCYQIEGTMRWGLRFHSETRTWSLNLALAPDSEIPTIPLYIARCPVILYHAEEEDPYGPSSTADPLASDPIDPRQELDAATIKLIFETFPRAEKAAVLIDGTLLLTYAAGSRYDYRKDERWGPRRFGGLITQFAKADTAFTGGVLSSSQPAAVNETSSTDENIKTDNENKGSTVPTNWRDRVEIRLDPQSSPQTVGTHTNLFIQVAKIKQRVSISFALGLRLQRQLKLPNEPRYATTMATHVLLNNIREDKHNLHKDATVSDLRDIKVRRQNANNELIHVGDVGVSFDDPKTDGEGLDHIHDVTLLKIREGHEDEFPGLTFSDDGRNDTKMEWLKDESHIGILGDHYGVKVVLLGANMLGELKTSSMSREPGTERMPGFIEFTQEELRRILRVDQKREHKLGPDGVEDPELEILIQGLEYSRANHPSRAIIWRPDFTQMAWSETLPDLKFSSGCPLAVKHIDEPTKKTTYRVFGFQMMQKIPAKLVEKVEKLSSEENQTADPRELKLFLRDGLGYYGAAVLSEELVKDWTIVWNHHRS